MKKRKEAREKIENFKLPTKGPIDTNALGFSGARIAGAALGQVAQAGLAGGLSGGIMAGGGMAVNNATAMNELAWVVGTKVKTPDIAKGEKYEHGIVYLTENADDPMREMFAHKMMRHMKENSPDTYSRYLRAVMDKLSSETGLKRSELIQQMGKRYSEQGIELTLPGAADEIVADFNMRVLSDPNELTELVRNTENLNDLQKRGIVSRVTNPIRAITNRFDNYERLTGRRIAPGEVAELRSIQKQLENIVAEKAARPSCLAP